MKYLITLFIITLALNLQAQLISKFTWASMPLTTAAQGPNGTSISSSATSSYINSTVGYAVNPGLPTNNVDLVVPGASFNVSNIDIDLYFRREESVASFFKRGSMFDFGSTGGQLTVKFSTTRGSTPGDTTINSGNIVAIADDHAFHHYRFRYDNNTGVAKVYVDGTVVYTYNGVAGRPLSWTNAGDVIIGENMDATSKDIPVMGTLTVQRATSAMLPLNIISFNASAKNNKAEIKWTVTEENTASKYVIERSSDNVHFKAVVTVVAEMKGTYSVVDNSPAAGTNSYRMGVEELNGKITYSAIRQISFADAVAKVTCFPNPATDHVNINQLAAGTYDYSVVNLAGVVVKTGSATMQASGSQMRIDLNNTASNTYVIKLNHRASNISQSLVIVKK